MAGEDKTKKSLNENSQAELPGRVSAETSETLREGTDYVLENGFFVFTRSYLLRRGNCCGSGCRNCPYEEQNPK